MDYVLAQSSDDGLPVVQEIYAWFVEVKQWQVLVAIQAFLKQFAPFNLILPAARKYRVLPQLGSIASSGCLVAAN